MVQQVHNSRFCDPGIQPPISSSLRSPWRIVSAPGGQLCRFTIFLVFVTFFVQHISSKSLLPGGGSSRCPSSSSAAASHPEADPNPAVSSHPLPVRLLPRRIISTHYSLCIIDQSSGHRGCMKSTHRRVRADDESRWNQRQPTGHNGGLKIDLQCTDRSGWR
jgi:hypothetical protein